MFHTFDLWTTLFILQSVIQTETKYLKPGHNLTLTACVWFNNDTATVPLEFLCKQCKLKMENSYIYVCLKHGVTILIVCVHVCQREHMCETDRRREIKCVSSGAHLAWVCVCLCVTVCTVSSCCSVAGWSEAISYDPGFWIWLTRAEQVSVMAVIITSRPQKPDLT